VAHELPEGSGCIVKNAVFCLNHIYHGKNIKVTSELFENFSDEDGDFMENVSD
jgi:hypothetical protein